MKLTDRGFSIEPADKVLKYEIVPVCDENGNVLYVRHTLVVTAVVEDK